ncbi:MAG: tripartite tricarboxylate transporter substrate binding protein [Burkholderiales bacterium]|nr:tripartite tricarboxylate transporter substrate binding protein [Burkholderiales bacterium]
MHSRHPWGFVVAALIALLALPVAAQSYPSRSVHNIVPFPSGGMDVVVRALAARMSARLGQPFVVENRPGASGNIGAQAVARAEPDGYTLLWVIDATLTINPALYPKIGFDPSRDFQPIALFNSVASVLLVHQSVEARNVADLVSLAKKTRLHYASGGNGSPGQLSTELFRSIAGIDLDHVPYKGNAPAVASILAGETQVFFSTTGGAMNALRSGRVRALATSSGERSRFLPEVPTMREAGYPEFDVSWWYALLAPAGTPAVIVDTLYRELERAVQQPELQKLLAPIAFEPTVSAPLNSPGASRRTARSGRSW